MSRKGEPRSGRKPRSTETRTESDGSQPRLAPPRRSRKPSSDLPLAATSGPGSAPVAPRAPRRRRGIAAEAVPEVPAEVQVEKANRAYYDAFQSLDLDAMSRSWWHDPFVSCIHPGWDLRRSWADVREGFEEIFDGTDSIRFALGDVQVRVGGSMALVTCVENLVSVEGGTGDYMGAVLATNVFERRGAEWRLIHHHAAPFMADDGDIPEGPLN